MISNTFRLSLLIFSGLLAAAGVVSAQGNAGSVRGTVTDPTGAVIPGATLRLQNPSSGFDRTTQSDGAGQFSFANVTLNNYQLTVTATGFVAQRKVVELRSTVGVNLTLALRLPQTAETITVEASGNLVSSDSTFHTEIDRDLFLKVPMESESSTLSSLVTATTPGISADSNGLFHGLGDHASNSFSVDGQSITDQQSKVFSNQIPSNSIQSLEVISGAPPAEYGGKTSLVIVATTRSGQGVTRPTGSISSSYGTFGSATGGFDLAWGGKNWGNFLEIDGLSTGRFLDPPEFQVLHDKGNEQNAFDRIDRAFNDKNSVHLDLSYSRSWFETPNSWDSTGVTNVVSGFTSPSPTFGPVGSADQRSEIQTFNISPTYTHVLNQYAVLNVGAFLRRDEYNYYPSGNPLADLGASNLQTASIGQKRTLTNAAIHSDISYSRGAHTFKAGVQYGQTFLAENDQLGIVSATYNSPCTDASGDPLAGFSSTSDCVAAGAQVNPNFLSVLAPYDLTRGRSYFNWSGRTDVKELALFAEDQIKAGNWLFNLGLRQDLYNGLTTANQTQPRVGLSYSVKRTGTVMRASYARTLETPFNENLVLSSEGCGNEVLSPLLNCSSDASATERPGFRNEFHAGFQQAVSSHVTVSGEYIWKYTHNAFDFSVLGNTPITFPIDWHNSKIPGWALHVDVPEFHGFSAYAVMSSVAARFYPPQVAGAGATVGQTGLPFRIDHDETFNQNTHFQYTLHTPGVFDGLWTGFNWRYDSGLVAGAAPCYNPLSNDANSACDPTSTLLNGQPAVDLSSLTADEEFQAGLTCNGAKATPTQALPLVCLASQYGSSLLRIPAPGTGDNDHNPPRVAPRNLFDASVGKQNLFHGERYKVDLDLTAVNIANKYALYNFLSTFSGTHYVTPRAMTAKLTLNF